MLRDGWVGEEGMIKGCFEGREELAGESCWTGLKSMLITKQRKWKIMKPTQKWMLLEGRDESVLQTVDLFCPSFSPFIV